MDSSQTPLYEIKANLFKSLAHPIRIRVLEIVAASAPEEVSVADLLDDLAIAPSLLSGHLAVLRRHQLLTSRRAGSHVFYRLAHPAVSELLGAARSFLLDVLDDSRQRLAALSTLPPLQ